METKGNKNIESELEIELNTIDCRNSHKKKYSKGRIKRIEFDSYTTRRSGGPIEVGRNFRIEYGVQENSSVQEIDTGFATSLPPILSIEKISFSETTLNAEETAQLSITIKNSGPGDARNMSIELSGGVSGLSFPAKTTFPTIGKNGGLKTINIDIKGKTDLPTGEATLNIQVIEPNFKVKIQGKRLRFPTREFRNPQLVLAKFGAVEGQASKPNQKINLNEIIEVKFVVQNTGVGTAENVSVLVENEQKGVMMLGVKESQDVTRKHPNFARIAAGKYEAITYQYFVNSEFKGFATVT